MFNILAGLDVRLLIITLAKLVARASAPPPYNINGGRPVSDKYPDGRKISAPTTAITPNNNRKVEARYGKENFGPYSDFEWGMINGKLSALRWVLGDEWDFLDT